MPDNLFIFNNSFGGSFTFNIFLLGLLQTSRSLPGPASPRACDPNSTILIGEPVARMCRTISSRVSVVTVGFSKYTLICKLRTLNAPN